MSPIEDFLERYNREQSHYRNAARYCEKLCRRVLDKKGVRALVSSREKDPDTLKKKLLERDSQKHYQDSQQIRDDIPDLAGARIALYFPDDKGEVEQLIRENFKVWKKKSHPDKSAKRPREKRFSGYAADHYIVSPMNALLPEEDKSLASSQVEIQVASLLMHAWSEVEHALIYKPRTGGLSQEEVDALDQLNGLVLSGEIALTQLQRGTQQRLADSGQPFDNHYELGIFLLNRFNDLKIEAQVGSEGSMGSVKELFSFLHMIGLLKPSDIEKYLRGVDHSKRSEPITNQIIDKIIEDTPEAKKQLEEVSDSETRKRLEEIPGGSVIKGSLPTLYWYSAIDGKRYVFPTEDTFRTWFPKKDPEPVIHELSDNDLVAIQIGGNVTYRPGTRLLKLKDYPNVYAVSHGGTLRPISNESVAASVFGEEWRSLVDIIPDAFFTNYTLGSPIFSKMDYDPAIEIDGSSTIDSDLGGWCAPPKS